VPIENNLFHGLKILVVDDHQFNLLLIETIARKWGCNVITARHGKEAIQLLHNEAFDLVLMDIQMPVLDGMEATGIIRSDPDGANQNIPIIAVTATKGDNEIWQYMKSGMDDISVIIRNLSHVKDFKHSTAPFQQILHAKKTEELYDLYNIHAVAKGDKEVEAELIRVFIDQTNEILAELNQTITETDWKSAAKLAHKLKSSIFYVRMPGMDEKVRYLQEVCEEGENENDILKLIHQINDRVNEVVGLLETYLKELFVR